MNQLHGVPNEPRPPTGAFACLPFGFTDQNCDLTQNSCGTLTMSKYFAAFYSLGFGKEQNKGVLAAMKRGRAPHSCIHVIM